MLGDPRVAKWEAWELQWEMEIGLGSVSGVGVVKDHGTSPCPQIRQFMINRPGRRGEGMV